MNLDNYIKFYSLRSYGMVGRHPVTESIYVHSKMMLVDDRLAIIGVSYFGITNISLRFNLKYQLEYQGEV